MCKKTCKYCGRDFRVNPSDCKNPDEYHCRDCRPQYIAEQRAKGVKIEYDWKTIKKINAAAMAHGHQSIFGRKP
jgi:hypothetical protein